jgi:cell division protein FtsB
MAVYDLPMRRLSLCLRRQWPSLMLAMLLGGLAVDGLCGSSGPRDLLVLRQHGSVLANERDALLADNAVIRDRIVRLRSDDAYLQQLIRQELGYVRPGEFVYRFPKSREP